MSLPGSSPTPDDRLLAALRDIIRERFPGLAYAGVYEYAVQTVGLTSVELLPTADIPFTSLPPLAYPVASYLITPLVVGTTCLVAFVNADPARPVLIPRVGDKVRITAAQMATAVLASATGGPVTSTSELQGTIGVGS